MNNLIPHRALPPDKAARIDEDRIIAAAIEIIDRRHTVDGICLADPETRRQFFSLKLGGFDREAKMTVGLNPELKVMNYEITYLGTLREVAVYTSQIAKFMLMNNCSRCIVAHCHPFGTAYPSKQDVDAAVKLSYGLSLVGVSLVDSIIIAGGRAFEMRAAGLTPFGKNQWTDPQQVVNE